MRIRRVAPSSLEMPALADMTFPRYRALLASLDERIVAFVAEQDEHAIGLVLSIAEAKGASLLSLFVRPAHRRQGVGRVLLAALEADLAQRGCHDIGTTWTQGTPGVEAFASVLKQQAWSTPQARMVIYRAEITQLGKARWMQAFTRLPDGHAIVPWHELSAQQLTKLRQAIRFESWVPRDLVPFDFVGEGIDGASPEPKLNLACLVWGEVVGWNFAHRIAEQTARISCTFVRPDLQQQLFILALWQEAFVRLAGSAYSQLSWAVSVERRAMVDFNDKYMAQYLSHRTESYESHKALGLDQAR